ncbi:MAG: hypothetical protein K9L74_06645 [Candidatus Izimaplasma sp.]|nr:hypothetical protein [Candidatus Izimaplasma bacterium]
MKLFLIGSALFTGFSGVAMQSPDVNETVSEVRNQIVERVGGFREARMNGLLERILEEGQIPYPPAGLLERLTEEQQTTVITKIDELNATYDFSSMTEEELLELLPTLQEELVALREELGIEPLQIRDRIREGMQHAYHNGFRDGFEEGHRGGFGGHHPFDEETDEPIDEQTEDPIDESNDTA